MVQITEGPIRLILRGDPRELKTISNRLRVRPTGYEYAPSYQAYVATEGAEGWDGFTSPLTFDRDDDGCARCLRGHKDAVLEVVRAVHFQVDTSKCLESPFSEITPGDIPDDLIHADFQLDQFQREGLCHWLKNGIGVNRLPVNAGKSACFAAAASMIKRRYGNDARILYITQSERLVRQAYKDIREFLPDLEITQYGGSKKDNTGKDMVISTVAMLWRNRKSLKDWLRTFICIEYDESHHCASATSSGLLMQIPAYFRFGASDTGHVNDPAKAAIVRGLLGPIRFTVPVGTYISMGRSAKPHVYLIENKAWKNNFRHVPQFAEPGTPAWALVGNDWKKGTYVGPVYELDDEGEIKTVKKRQLAGTVDTVSYDDDGRVIDGRAAEWEMVEAPVVLEGWHCIRFENDPQTYEIESEYCLLNRAYDKALTTFKSRNEMIVTWAKYYSQECSYPTLVVCTRTLHVLILEGMLKASLGEDKVQVLVGNDSPKKRDLAFEWFRHTPGGVLISPLVKEGVSINEIRGGVIADYVGNEEVMMQILGRFIRKKEVDNEAHITAFMDTQHPSMARGCKRIWNRLFDTRGFTFYHPVLGPDSIEISKRYEALD